MIENELTTLRNGAALPLAELSEMPLSDFLQGIIDLTGRQWRIASYFGAMEEEGVSLWCVLAGTDKRLAVMRSWVENSLPSIVLTCPEAHLFEREIAEQCGLALDGHPWLKPVRYQPGMQKTDARGNLAPALPGSGAFYRVEGEEVHEVAVGPVHAGIIEPGHFRFQCHGEKVYHLEIALGYQHRGIERALAKGPHPASLYQMETVAGDTTIGHASAYAMVNEALGDIQASTAAEAVRALALELERLANHCGDMGALAGDVGFLPTMSFCGRLRGDFLNMTALLCGSRFGRGLIRPGGTLFGCSPQQSRELIRRLHAIRLDYGDAVRILFDADLVMTRFDKTGIVSREDALAAGLVGPAARACGIARDVRSDHPFGFYRACGLPMQTAASGDVLARAQVRWKESVATMDYVHERLDYMPEGDTMRACPPARPEMLAVALVEGWRGEICHTAITDKAGRFLRYKIVDPSFHNWTGLALALRNEQISDFPLCNKSFNLSYCGFDL